MEALLPRRCAHWRWLRGRGRGRQRRTAKRRGRGQFSRSRYYQLLPRVLQADSVMGRAWRAHDLPLSSALAQHVLVCRLVLRHRATAISQSQQPRTCAICVTFVTFLVSGCDRLGPQDASCGGSCHQGEHRPQRGERYVCEEEQQGCVAGSTVRPRSYSRQLSAC